MRSLANESDKTAVLGRLRALKPDSARRWGKMSPHEMVCHLNDSFKAAIGTKPVSSVNTNMLIRTLARWFALYVPVRWPRGVPTRPEMDPQRQGTLPTDFDRDVATLAAMIERVSNPNKDFAWYRHPFFAEMSERDWLRWGYLHTDHHLRQFGL